MTFFQMTKTVLKSLFTRPATLMYPAKPAKKTSLSRGHVTIDPTKCITCRLCQRKCPTQAICVEVKEKTWEIDNMRCVVCSVCVDVCPTKSLTMETEYRKVITTRGARDKFTVAGPKKKEPVVAEAAKPVKE
ncbi:MAG: 4Fe-4S dicluster domain-containing protein [Methanoregula sp.]